MTELTSRLLKAKRHLARRDAVLKKLIAGVGPCTLRPNGDPFLTLAASIISQQISAKAATSIRAKLGQTLAVDPLTPAAVAAATDAQFRSAGVSAGEQRALRDLAGRIQSGQLLLDDLGSCDEETVIGRLLPVYGIGRWTAQMFLIFALGRLDVLPTADLGLR